MGSKPRGISGSRAASILGLSQWATPYETWCKLAFEQFGAEWMLKHGHEIPQDELSAPAKWGLAMEQAVEIVALAEQQPRYNSIECQEKAFGLDGYTTCHVDGIYRGWESAQALHEGKTTSNWAYRDGWGTPGTDEIPQQYQIQVQHNMMCTHLRECIVSVLVWPDTVDTLEAQGWAIREHSDKELLLMHPDGKPGAIRLAESLRDLGYFHQYHIEADPKLHKIMRKEYGNFWESVIKNDPPSSKTCEEARARLKTIKGTAQATPEIETVSAALRDCKAHMKNFKEQESNLKKILIEYMRTHAEPTADAKRLELLAQDGTRLHTFNGKQFR